jgi:hypothetical protein
MQKQKEQEANNMIMKVGAKVVRKELMKKRNTVIESFSNFDNEVSLSPSKEFYSVMEVTPKNDQQLVCFAKAKRHVPNSTTSFSILFSFFSYIS